MSLKTLVCVSALACLPIASASTSTFTVKLGQTVPLAGGQFTLVSMTDSRCPPRAFCLMAGNVRARVLLVQGQTSRFYTVFLPGQPVATISGTLRLKTATSRDTKGLPRLVFEVTPR